jgi:hypothetical protein
MRIFFAFVLDLGSGIFAIKYCVTGFYFHLDEFDLLRCILPLPTATTSPFMGFSFAVSGRITPPFVFSSLGMGLMITLSPSGVRLMV